MKEWNLNNYLMAFRDDEGYGYPEEGKSYRSSLPLSGRITCVDGFSLSVQATSGAYCGPRKNTGPWFSVEVGFPSAKPELIMGYAEDEENPTDTVYAYVPIKLVEELISLHGGPNDEAIAKADGKS